MQLSILGPVLVDGRTPRGAKERALLARLLVAPGTPVGADTLIEAAWSADRSDGVVRSLHVRLAKLRALLDPERPAGAAGSVLVREPTGYRLAVAPESVDAHRFARLADGGAGALRRRARRVLRGGRARGGDNPAGSRVSRERSGRFGSRDR